MEIVDSNPTFIGFNCYVILYLLLSLLALSRSHIDIAREIDTREIKIFLMKMFFARDEDVAFVPREFAKVYKSFSIQ